MTTQLEYARQGTLTSQMQIVAKNEGLPESFILDHVAKGEIVIPCNPNRPNQIVTGIGTGLRTKVNASIGTSSDICDIGLEVEKAQAAQEEGADTLMELSADGDLDDVRRIVLANTDLAVGNVPLYQAFKEAIRKYRNPAKLDPEYLFELIERQLEDGLSFMAIHCGINQYTIERLRKQGFRYGGLASKGGTYMVAWMDINKKENPLYEQFDRVCALMKKYDAVLSLGNGIRAGAIHDSHDRAQMAEMIINCELAEIGRAQGCQMMVEGPGHVPLDEIEGNIMLEKRMSGNAPYYVLGPIPCDTGAGYDHITAAIGAASSARFGADLICYITPAEHLALPNVKDVREGVRATRLAVRIGDISKYPDRRENEKQAAMARRDMRWNDLEKYLLFPEVARNIRDSRAPSQKETCTMCGDFCAMKKGMEIFEKDITDKR
ncbi:MAG: phosphomethylpyrimidine synthase ThiC [Proteobacteria bacterium]|nr:phosphomethylpyrimidine synthase ThiC [Pseudomonadota bacterium]MBU1390027.1 phosphomethylpyrimidine synthase ThiC [Pseudomonadota bacterium]MBU1545022.1 phosphomethylpyrimidine synthase ThiC [Pseudomonadota bacterium]MBU2430333.1 phosphomethylpyrimidine synthase ThiC [Pseudomonadota bacterium]MBU2480374.1 phosphomethylpyrimidine synthase ThiC [Pseudomonadota bacterium]